MKIRIDGIATVWLQKRGLPTKRGATAEEYKARVEAYLLANPTDWPYYNREGRANPIVRAAAETTTPKQEYPKLPAESGTGDGQVRVGFLHPTPKQRYENEQDPKEDPLEGEGKVHFVIVRYTPLGIREFLKTLAYQDQKESEKWSEDPAWADRFLNPNGARLLAKRILGHSKFKVEPL